MSNLLKPLHFLQLPRRFVMNKAKAYNWRDEGIQYPGFKYYPRYENFKDPPYEPTKLFRVQRIKTLKGVPHYEKKIVKDFKLDGKISDVAIIKNIPENNQRLWKIKHLIKIEPITFPNGFPKDTIGTQLKENGEFVVSNIVNQQHEELLRLTEEHRKKVERLDGDTLRRDSRRKWMDGWE